MGHVDDPVVHGRDDRASLLTRMRPTDTMTLLPTALFGRSIGTPWCALDAASCPQVAMDESTVPKHTIRASLLGQVRLSLGDRPLPDDAWLRRAPRSLFLLLLATPGYRLPRDQVLDLLWPDVPAENALNALYVALHALRRVLEPDLRAGRTSAYVDLSRDTVRLRPDTVAWVDVDAFEAALAAAAITQEDRQERLREAVALYGGDLLADEPYLDWPVARRERLRLAFRRAVLELAESELAARPLAEVPALERLLFADPTDEPVYRLLMRALAAAGRRDDALGQFERCAGALRTEMGVEPAVETVALANEIRAAVPIASRPSVTAAPAVRLDNLPTPPTPLIGRGRELESLQDLLLDPDVRLVTVTGPAGIGKTRLALEAARQAADEFTDGVCFVPLAAVRQADLVLPSIARSLGVQEGQGRSAVETLGEALHDRDLLLVLDNLEQVVDVADEIATLLAGCRRLKVLATSREPLHLRAEHVWSTPPLAVPPAGPSGSVGRLGAETVGRYAAAALFVERARAARPDFVLTDANAAAVGALCARLDGLPLAIELAAARSRHLTPTDLLPRLERRLPLLTGGPRDLPERQRTLRDAIAWSHDLLGAAEQVLYRRLAVFAGGFTLEAAEAVCPAAGHLGVAIADAVWALTDKSLLRSEEGDGGPRYGMLETVLEFGSEQLAASGEEDRVRRAYAAYLIAVAEEAEPHLFKADQISWRDRLEAEHDNFRAALGWACAREDAATAQGLSGALTRFWRMTGYLGEGRAWLDRALAIGSVAPSAARAKALLGAGTLAYAQGDFDPAVTHLNAALEDGQTLGNQRLVARALSMLESVARGRGDYERAGELNDRALALYEALADRPGIADALNGRALNAAERGDYARSRELHERSLALFRRLGDRHGAGRVLNNLGVQAFYQEQYREASDLFGQSLALWRSLGDRPITAIVLANLGEALRADGDLDRAVAIASEGLARSREVGDRRSAATALFILGSLVQHESYDPRAAGLLAEGLLLFHQSGDRRGMAWCLEGLTGPAAMRGRPDIAARMFGAAEALREQIGVPILPAERATYQRHLAAAQSGARDQAAFGADWATGRTLPLDTLVALADELVPVEAPAAPVAVVGERREPSTAVIGADSR